MDDREEFDDLADPLQYINRHGIPLSQGQPRAPRIEVQGDASPLTILNTAFGGRHIRLPHDLFEGGLVSRLERTRPGLFALCVVLLRYADRRNHAITASRTTIQTECGIRRSSTLTARLAILSRGDERSGLPSLIQYDRHLKGIGYRFRPEGLAQGVALVRDTLAAQERHRAWVRERQSIGGERGMARRYGRRGQAAEP
jgi:hypothetical protein